METQTKVCRTCKQTLPITSFTKGKCDCMPCRNEKQKQDRVFKKCWRCKEHKDRNQFEGRGRICFDCLNKNQTTTPTIKVKKTMTDDESQVIKLQKEIDDLKHKLISERKDNIKIITELTESIDKLHDIIEHKNDKQFKDTIY